MRYRVGAAECGCCADATNNHNGRSRDGDNASSAHELMGMTVNLD
jgi:hypothetical protein